jgi:hypothetical protein
MQGMQQEQLHWHITLASIQTPLSFAAEIARHLNLQIRKRMLPVPGLLIAHGFCQPVSVFIGRDETCS